MEVTKKKFPSIVSNFHKNDFPVPLKKKRITIKRNSTPTFFIITGNPKKKGNSSSEKRNICQKKKDMSNKKEIQSTGRLNITSSLNTTSTKFECRLTKYFTK